MNGLINRRDFLKIAGILSAQTLLPVDSLKYFRSAESATIPNILIIVFDAWSAYHLSFYGYPRETTPLLSSLLNKAIVYHNHHSAGSFTTPGTASLLTGLLPWTHQALNHNGKVHEPYARNNLFYTLNSHYSIAYSHNFLVNTLLEQFSGPIDWFIPRSRLFLNRDKLIELLFRPDEDIASVSWANALKRNQDHIPYSLFLSRLYEDKIQHLLEQESTNFPRGLPSINVDNYFKLEMGIDYLVDLLVDIPRPFWGYFHFLPPHEPYHTRKEFTGIFKNDGFKPVKKTPHLFSQGQKLSNERKWREFYDEYILYVDFEFTRMYHDLDRKGILDNTWIFLTSDHGELFERGIIGHLTPVLHQPLIRVPLIIFEPGRKDELHIFDPTTSIDILPTVLKLCGKEIPAWAEGEILPPFRDSAVQSSRRIFSFDAKTTRANQAIVMSTAAVIQDQYKLIRYIGYPELSKRKPLIELYDLKNDPQEVEDLSNQKTKLAEDYIELLDSSIKTFPR
jgi:arylsulfatase A-like enzyme